MPYIIVNDNRNQFVANPLKKWCQDTSIKKNITSVAHPKENRQVEETNETIVKGIKKRLGKSQRYWADEMQNVLWSYQITAWTPTKET